MTAPRVPDSVVTPQPEPLCNEIARHSADGSWRCVNAKGHSGIHRFMKDAGVVTPPEEPRKTCGKQVGMFRACCTLEQGHEGEHGFEDTTASDEEAEPDTQLLAWAVMTCHTLARRRLNANS